MSPHTLAEALAEVERTGRLPWLYFQTVTRFCFAQFRGGRWTLTDKGRAAMVRT